LCAAREQCGSLDYFWKTERLGCISTCIPVQGALHQPNNPPEVEESLQDVQYNEATKKNPRARDIQAHPREREWEKENGMRR